MYQVDISRKYIMARKKSALLNPGEGRPFTIWIDRKILPELEKLAAARNISRSTLTRQIVFDFVNNSKNETSVA